MLLRFRAFFLGFLFGGLPKGVKVPQLEEGASACRIRVVLPQVPKRVGDLTNDEAMVRSIILQRVLIPRKAIQDATGFSMLKTTMILNALLIKGAIKRTGTGKNTRYQIK